MGSQQYCLRWNNHQSNMLTVFRNMFSSEALVDVTLACEGAKIHAHKVVLSACSPFFQDIFMSNPCKHPVVILKDMKHAELRAILEYMYKGEINVSQENLPNLLKSAENLKVKGLAEVTSEQQKAKNFLHNSSMQTEVEIPTAPAHISSHISPVLDEVMHKRRRKRRKSDQNCDISVNRICKVEDGNKSPEDSNFPRSPTPHENFEQTESTLPQQTMTSDVQNTPHAQSPQYKENMDENERILEPHEIKRSISPVINPASNPEFVLDPTSFMEQSLTTDQAYASNQSAKERLSPSNSSSMIITASNDSSLDCNQSDSSVFVEESPMQGPSHSSISPGLGIQYDSNANNTSGGLMMYAEPGTSSSGPPGTSGINSNRPGSPNKNAEPDLSNPKRGQELTHRSISTLPPISVEKLLSTINQDLAPKPVQELPAITVQPLPALSVRELRPTPFQESPIPEGLKPMKKCPICHMYVASKLKRHMDRHTNVKVMHFCDICLKPISRKDHLRRHKREVHNC